MITGTVHVIIVMYCDCLAAPTPLTQCVPGAVLHPETAPARVAASIQQGPTLHICLSCSSSAWTLYRHDQALVSQLPYTSHTTSSRVCRTLHAPQLGKPSNPPTGVFAHECAQPSLITTLPLARPEFKRSKAVLASSKACKLSK